MGNRQKNAMIHFWVTPETNDLVKRIATERGTSASSVYRDLLEQGLISYGYRSGEQSAAELAKKVVEEGLQPHVDRLAAISAKAAQISAASFFLAVYNGRQAVPDELKEEYDDLAAQARKLGIEYLKLSKDRSLDDFISRGIHRMRDDH